MLSAMIKRFPILMVLCTAFGTATVSAQKGLAVDVLASTVVWSASKVGGSHTGDVSLASGVLTVENGVLLLADVSMNMQSITCSDLSSASSNAKLVSHLKDEDFFHVSSHPRAHFRTTSVERKAQVGERTTFHVEGVLTIKGIEAPNAFDVDLWAEGDRYRATGAILFDRTVYGIQYGSGSFFEGLGNRMIKDEVELGFDLRTQ